MTRVIGIDPGPMPGFVVLEQGRAPVVLQCSAAAAPMTLASVLLRGSTPTIVAIEKFVVRRGAAKSGAPGAVTRDLVGQLLQVADQSHTPTTVVLRSAAQVKPWATDARLDAAGLLEATKGMRHARDAARHNLYAAVHDGGLPDPLSRSWASR